MGEDKMYVLSRSAVKALLMPWVHGESGGSGSSQAVDQFLDERLKPVVWTSQSAVEKHLNDDDDQAVVEAYREAAKRIHEVEGLVEIDELDAVVSLSEDHGAGGAYVQAWVWVDEDELNRSDFSMYEDKDFDLEADDELEKE